MIKIGQNISNKNFPIHLAYGIINYDFTQVEKLVKFILLAFFPFSPLMVILFGKINKNIEISTSLILFSSIMIFSIVSLKTGAAHLPP